MTAVSDNAVAATVGAYYPWTMSHFDYILAGGGAAGLSLAYHMMHGGCEDKRILIIDPAEKRENDRTWCFWIDRPMLFDPIVAYRWRYLWFHGPERSHRLSLEPYDYRMIRGIDFYNFVLADLRKRGNVTFLPQRVERITDGDDHAPATVLTDGGDVVTGDYVFDSVFLARDFLVDTRKYSFLKQHFAGWKIRTDEPVFDAEAATFFDLRVPQKGAFRFMYLLPESPTESLVEYTLFSSRLLPKEEYQEALREYIRDYLGNVGYTILEQEEGVIPMTDQPFTRRAGNRILNIGTRGGRVKASTGFAFLRTQVDSERIVRSLRDSGSPFHGESAPGRYATFDAMLLQVLEAGAREQPAASGDHDRDYGDSGRSVFVALFERNPITRLLRFLDEEGTIGENIRLMSTVPWWPFIAAWFRVKWRRLPGRTRRLVDPMGYEREQPE